MKECRNDKKIEYEMLKVTNHILKEVVRVKRKTLIGVMVTMFIIIAVEKSDRRYGGIWRKWKKK